jgi:starvation-inducible DNA-binding protein
MNVEKPEVVNAVARVLGDTFVFSMKAQGAHWNVAGPDFSANHAFFSEIYEDVSGAIDPLAEFFLKLGSPAPTTLMTMVALSGIPENEMITTSFSELCSDLHAANDVILEDINYAFKIADQYDEQGIADFLAGRDDMHKKWRWQIGASLNMQNEGPEYV